MSAGLGLPCARVKLERGPPDRGIGRGDGVSGRAWPNSWKRPARTPRLKLRAWAGDLAPARPPLTLPFSFAERGPASPSCGGEGSWGRPMTERIDEVEAEPEAAPEGSAEATALALGRAGRGASSKAMDAEAAA